MAIISPLSFNPRDLLFVEQIHDLLVNKMAAESSFLKPLKAVFVLAIMGHSLAQTPCSTANACTSASTPKCVDPNTAGLCTFNSLSAGCRCVPNCNSSGHQCCAVIQTLNLLGYNTGTVSATNGDCCTKFKTLPYITCQSSLSPVN